MLGWMNKPPESDPFKQQTWRIFMTNLEWAKSLDVPDELKSLLIQKSIFASGCTAESFHARAQIAVLKTMSANEILQAFMEESGS